VAKQESAHVRRHKQARTKTEYKEMSISEEAHRYPTAGADFKCGDFLKCRLRKGYPNGHLVSRIGLDRAALCLFVSQLFTFFLEKYFDL